MSIDKWVSHVQSKKHFKVSSNCFVAMLSPAANEQSFTRNGSISMFVDEMFFKWNFTLQKLIFHLTKIKETAEEFWSDCGTLAGFYPGKIRGWWTSAVVSFLGHLPLMECETVALQVGASLQTDMRQERPTKGSGNAAEPICCRNFHCY